MNKEQLITLINQVKPEAIKQGFDYPTNADFTTATTEELQAFFNEIQDYAIEAIIREMGYEIEARQ